MCGKSHYTSRCTDFNVRQMLLFGKVIYHNDVICLATRVQGSRGLLSYMGYMYMYVGM